MPFLKGDYVYEILRESKTKMGDNLITETIIKTEYDDNNNIVSIIVTTNGEKTLEMIDYVYGDRKMTNLTNQYLNGQLFSSMKTNNTYDDDFYRNIAVGELETIKGGIPSIQRNEWTYDDQGRMTGMKQYIDGNLSEEQKDYTWTSKSCEYFTYSYSPIQYTEKVTKKFEDDNYVRNVLELHQRDMNGFNIEIKNEATYDNEGNLTSLKSYTNGELTLEFSDYIWGDKKNTHKETMYVNGSPSMISEVTQYYK